MYIHYQQLKRGPHATTRLQVDPVCLMLQQHSRLFCSGKLQCFLDGVYCFGEPLMPGELVESWHSLIGMRAAVLRVFWRDLYQLMFV